MDWDGFVEIDGVTTESTLRVATGIINYAPIFKTGAASGFNFKISSTDTL
jgi:hypothetical protein